MINPYIAVGTPINRQLKPLTPYAIFCEVAGYYKVYTYQLTQHSRKHPFVHYRQLAWLLMETILHMKHGIIAAVSKHERSVVSTALKAIRAVMDVDKKLAADYEYLQQILRFNYTIPSKANT